jgi:thiol-disulfide isomerase/thioredoxin
MKKTMLVFSLILASMNAFSQSYTSDYDTSTDAENSAIVYRGQIKIRDLESEKTFNWMKEGEKSYTPDATALAYLELKLKDYEMVIFMGTWCSDSHELIPKLSKLLEATSYPLPQLTLYGVDRAKTTKNGAEKLYNITLVPTVILFKGSKEVGRITETVSKTLEDDLMNMILIDQK